jgi:pyruvate kinase
MFGIGCTDDDDHVQVLGDGGKQIMIISKIENQQGIDVSAH